MWARSTSSLTPPPRAISQTRLQKGGIGNNLIDSQCWICTLNDRATYQTKWFFKGEESGGDFVGDLMLFGWEEIKDSRLHPLETDCWGAVPGQLFLAWQLFALQEGNCGWWMFPSSPPEHILEFAPPPSDSWPWLQATGILSSPLPHVLRHVSCPWLKSLCSPATIGGDCLSEGDSWFGDKGCKELMLCPLNPAVWLPVGLLKDEEILLQLPYPDLQKVQKECSKEYIEEELYKNVTGRKWEKHGTEETRKKTMELMISTCLQMKAVAVVTCFVWNPKSQNHPMNSVMDYPLTLCLLCTNLEW